MKISFIKHKADLGVVLQGQFLSQREPGQNFCSSPSVAPWADRNAAGNAAAPQWAQAAHAGTAHGTREGEQGSEPTAALLQAGLAPATLQYIPHPASTLQKQGTSQTQGSWGAADAAELKHFLLKYFRIQQMFKSPFSKAR